MNHMNYYNKQKQWERRVGARIDYDTQVNTIVYMAGIGMGTTHQEIVNRRLQHCISVFTMQLRSIQWVHAWIPILK